MTKTIPGTLGIIEQAMLASGMPWQAKTEGGVIVALWCQPYKITSSGDNPRYWSARAPDATELAAGAGDLGLAKCIRACDRHSASSNNAAQKIRPPRLSSNNDAEPQSAADPGSKDDPIQQQQLL